MFTIATSGIGSPPEPGVGFEPVSTRRLIITALLCGMAILIAFAVQASQWS